MKFTEYLKEDLSKMFKNQIQHGKEQNELLKKKYGVDMKGLLLWNKDELNGDIKIGNIVTVKYNPIYNMTKGEKWKMKVLEFTKNGEVLTKPV